MHRGDALQPDNLMSSVGIGGIRNSIFKKDVSPADTKKTEFQ